MRWDLYLKIDQTVGGNWHAGWYMRCSKGDHCIWGQIVEITKADDLTGALRDAREWRENCGEG